jgi:protein-S-isoprenylcysteine O-methyltransferase
MLNHSLQYEIAAVSSWIEFFVEVYYFPQMKKYKMIWIVGSLICFLGEVLRKTAMLTAKKSFHHLVSHDVPSSKPFFFFFFDTLNVLLGTISTS